MSSETRIMTCPYCAGDGGWESSPTGYNHVNGQPTTHWIGCTLCDGKGEAEFPIEPRTLLDMDEEAEQERGSG